MYIYCILGEVWWAKSNLSTPLVPHLHPSELAWSYIVMEGEGGWRGGGKTNGRNGKVKTAWSFSRTAGTNGLRKLKEEERRRKYREYREKKHQSYQE